MSKNPHEPPASTAEPWHLYQKGVTRQQGRLKTRQNSASRKPESAPRARRGFIEAPPLPNEAPTARLKALAAPLSRKDARAMTGPRRSIDASLDLHGLSRTRAYAVLCRFIVEATARRYKTILVITGKGRPLSGQTAEDSPTPSVLRTALPTWCAAPPLDAYIARMAHAAPAHGGTGAFYLFLKTETKKPSRGP